MFEKTILSGSYYRDNIKKQKNYNFKIFFGRAGVNSFEIVIQNINDIRTLFKVSTWETRGNVNYQNDYLFDLDCNEVIHKYFTATNVIISTKNKTSKGFKHVHGNPILKCKFQKYDKGFDFNQLDSFIIDKKLREKILKDLNIKDELII